MTPDLLTRLAEAKEGCAECILWPRALDKLGRGRIWHEGKLMLAHRWVWERMVGPIPAGMLLCHHCDNPTCVRPAHIYVGTHADNMRDMKERGRYFFAIDPDGCRAAAGKGGKQNTWSRGAGNPKAKLSPEIVAQIRLDARETRFLVAQYGVTRTTIQRIRRGATWAA